jgi:hypothetical protein
MQIRRFKPFAELVVVIITFAISGAAYAKTTTFTCQDSGTGVSAFGDLDNDSCTTAPNGVTTCTDTSANSNVAFKCSPGGVSGTGINLIEYDPVPGTSCNIAGTQVPGIATCTLANSSEQGCEFKSVGGAEVDRDDKTLDMTFATVQVTLCLDLSSPPPNNFTGTSNSTITGGTGANAGATGNGTSTFNGQSLVSDEAGHGLSWAAGTGTVTITTTK